jgi:hypothetical protein
MVTDVASVCPASKAPPSGLQVHRHQKQQARLSHPRPSFLQLCTHCLKGRHASHAARLAPGPALPAPTPSQPMVAAGTSQQK